jgi:hypothetical protein
VIRKWDRSIHWTALNCFTLLWYDRVNLLPFPVVVESGMGFFFGPGSGGSGD